MVLQSSHFSPDLRKNTSLLFLMKIIIFVMVAKCINKFLFIKLWWVISLETVEGIHSGYINWNSESHSAVFWKGFEWGPKDISEREIDLCVRSNRKLELWNKKIYVACSALWKVQMRCGWTPGNGGWRESNVKCKESGIWCNQTRVQYLLQLLSSFVIWIESVNISEPLFSFFYDRDMGRPLIHTPLWMLSLA